MPGAHSDIGGGYSETAYENKYLGLEGKKPRDQIYGSHYIDHNWFIKKGYYTPEQISKKQEYSSFISPHEAPKIETKLYGKREVSYLYQFIMADIMREIASQKAGYEVDTKESYLLSKGINEMKTKPLLAQFHQLASDYVMANFNKKGGGYHPPLLPQS